MGTETWIISLLLSDSILYLKIIHPPNFREEPIFLFHQNYSANGRFSPNIMVETCAHIYLPNMKSHAELQHGFINSNLKFLKCPKLRDSL